MPQKNAGIERIRVTLTTSKQVHQYLSELVATGLYGGSVPEAAEIIICRYLMENLKASKLEPINPARV